jgi:GT2 family glycosyltransferase
MIADVAIVIPTHNGLDHTRRCLASLAQHAPNIPVYVVDDGSVDGTAEFLEAAAGVTRIEGTGNLWWSGSVNIGCRAAVAAGAKRILLLNNDNIVGERLVEELAAAHQVTDGCVSAPVLRQWDGTRGKIVTAGGILDWTRRGISLRAAGEEFVPVDRLEDVDWLPGAPLFFGVDLYEALDGFDDQHFPQYRGDVDFTARARSAGHRCVVTWRTYVVNDQSQTGLDFRRRVTPHAFVRGLFSLRSNYNFRETIGFARRHCPPSLRVRYLALFYLRYTYASAKTWFRIRPRHAAVP